MSIFDEIRQLREQWPMARRYGYRWDLVVQSTTPAFERVWLCRIRRLHRVKYASNGRCIRCGRRVVLGGR